MRRDDGSIQWIRHDLPDELIGHGIGAGDIDKDGVVHFSDFLILSTNFGLEDATWQDGDLSGDGIVSLTDFLLLSSNFTETA